MTTPNTNFKLIVICSTICLGCAQGPNDGKISLDQILHYGFSGGFVWLTLLIFIGTIVYFMRQTSTSKAAYNTTPASQVDTLKEHNADGKFANEEDGRQQMNLDL